MSLADLLELNKRVYAPEWDTPERLFERARLYARYGADIQYLPLSWVDVVGPFLDDLGRRYRGIRFTQVKEKLGELRVYAEPDSHASAIDELIRENVEPLLVARGVYRPSLRQ